MAVKRPVLFETRQNASLWTMLGAIVLLSAIMGGSSIGPISNYIPPKSSLLKNSWRYGILVIFLVIPAAIEFLYQCKV